MYTYVPMSFYTCHILSSLVYIRYIHVYLDNFTVYKHIHETQREREWKRERERRKEKENNNYD